jgi:hypothetical protein
MDAAIRDRWRKEVVSTEDWVQHIDQARAIQPGEAGGFLVRSTQSGLLGYLKPLNHNAQVPRAAYEKIAADLAYEVHVSVPPAALHRRANPPAGQPKEVAISLVWGRSSVWGDLFNLSDPGGGLPASPPALRELVRTVLARGSGVLAFDTWLRNGDRNNARNAILAYDLGDNPGKLLYLDFSNTMDHDRQWTNGNHSAFGRVDIPPFFAACLDRKIVREAAERIAGLSDDLVAGIVQRMPDDFLATDTRERLSGWLVWRKGHLLDSWDQWYAGA